MSVRKYLHTDTGDDILPKKCCNTGPDRDAVDDDNEHPRKDAHCHLQLRIRVVVIFIALDEVSITGDGNGKGDNLGVGDGPGGQDDLELDDALGTRFQEGFVHPGRSCFVQHCFNFV